MVVMERDLNAKTDNKSMNKMVGKFGTWDERK